MVTISLENGFDGYCNDVDIVDDGEITEGGWDDGVPPPPPPPPPPVDDIFL